MIEKYLKNLGIKSKISPIEDEIKVIMLKVKAMDIPNSAFILKRVLNFSKMSSLAPMPPRKMGTAVPIEEIHKRGTIKIFFMPNEKAKQAMLQP